MGSELDEGLLEDEERLDEMRGESGALGPETYEGPSGEHTYLVHKQSYDVVPSF